MPDVIIIAGPNGAGKSILAPYLLRDTLGVLEYVNADTIAEGLSAFAPENASFEAGRVMLTRLKQLAGDRQDFAFETTLATRSYSKWLKELQVNGYRVSLVFLWLGKVETAIERVNSRVRLGGHSIPEETIRSRFERVRRNLFELYLTLANAWRVFDGAHLEPVEIARYSEFGGEKIFQAELWSEIRN